MRIHSGRRGLGRRLSVYAIAAAISVAAPAQHAANAFQITKNPVHAVAVHDFGEEHAHLADSVFDTINPLILAALPRGKAHVEYRAPAKCVPASLRSVLAKVSAKYGPITVNSTYRSPGKNRKVGGRGKSMHLSCRAVDFRVHGNSRGMMQFLAAQAQVGGLNRYPSGFYHIDNGPRRTW
ncbi:MAG: D-Ala-D-Ala carboxypeptidase family metallohydrolase [Rhizobiaceae bacterium]